MPIIQSVNVTQGTSQSTGKPWTRYDVVLDDGRQASGFAFVKVGDTVNVQQKGQYLNFTPSLAQGGATQSHINYPQAASAPVSRSNGGVMSRDDYWARKEDYDREREARFVANQPRIERQHSQEMALRYFDVAGGFDMGADKDTDGMSNTQKLRLLIDWFQRDIGRSPERTTKPVVEPDQTDIGGEIQPPDEPPF